MVEFKDIRPLVTALAILVVPSVTVAQASGSYSLSGSEVAIYNLAGTVDVVAGSGSNVDVRISSDGADADELSVEVGPIDGAETLRVLYPSDRVVYSDGRNRGQTRLRVRDDGTFFGRSNRGDRVSISRSGRGLEAWADMTISIPRGRTVSVNLGIGSVSATNVDGNLEIRVAAAPVETSNTAGSLNINTGSGSVEVRGARGPVDVATGSGSVDVFDVTGDVLSVQTGSGGIDGGNLVVDRLNVQTGSGGIDLEETSFDEGNLRTGSGSISLDLLTDVSELDLKTGSGRITVYFDPSLGAQLDLETGSGGIDFDVPITVRRFDRRSLTGSIGDGEGSINVDTGSGSIRFIERN